MSVTAGARQAMVLDQAGPLTSRDEPSVAEPNVRNEPSREQPEDLLVPGSMIMVDEWAPNALDVWCELYANAPVTVHLLSPAEDRYGPLPAARRQRPRLIRDGILITLVDQAAPMRWGELTHRAGQLTEVRWYQGATDTCTPQELARLKQDLAARLTLWADRDYLPVQPLNEEEDDHW